MGEPSLYCTRPLTLTVSREAPQPESELTARQAKTETPKVQEKWLMDGSYPSSGYGCSPKVKIPLRAANRSTVVRILARNQMIPSSTTWPPRAARLDVVADELDAGVAHR